MYVDYSQVAAITGFVPFVGYTYATGAYFPIFWDDNGYYRGPLSISTDWHEA